MEERYQGWGGDLAGDGVGDAGHFDDLPLEAKVGAEEDEGERDAEPEDHEDDEGAEGDSRRRLASPHDHVDDKEHGKAHAGEDDRRQERGLEVVWLLDQLAEASCRVSGGDAHEDVEEEDGREKCAAVGRGEEAESGECESEDGHDKELHPRSGVD